MRRANVFDAIPHARKRNSCEIVPSHAGPCRRLIHDTTITAPQLPWWLRIRLCCQLRDIWWGVPAVAGTSKQTDNAVVRQRSTKVNEWLPGVYQLSVSFDDRRFCRQGQGALSRAKTKRCGKSNQKGQGKGSHRNRSSDSRFDRNGRGAMRRW